MIDDRIVRVSLEINGELRTYEGLRVRATGTKYTSPTQNESTITVSGLRAETRDYILGSIDITRGTFTPRRVILEVGRRSLGTFVLFVGDIVGAEVTEPPEVDLILKAKTNNSNNGRVVSASGGARTTLREIAEQVASDNGLRLVFEAPNKNVSNYQFIGTASQQVKDLERIGGTVDCFIDDDTLFVKSVEQPVSGRIRILSMGTGLVGIPRATDIGVDVSYLLDAESALGGLLRLDSRFNRTLSGDYVIQELKFDVSTHDDPFFYHASCRRLVNV